MKKQIIWTSNYYFDDKAREEYENSQRDILDDEDYTVSDAEWAEVINDYLSDERMNLDRQIDGVVMAFADLGFWNGRRQGYKILGHNVNGIFNVSEDDNEWYGDGFNIRGSLTHHDGTHYVLYRVVKDIDEAERIGEMIYNREIDEVGFRKRHARSIRMWLRFTAGKQGGLERNSIKRYDWTDDRLRYGVCHKVHVP